MGTPTTTNRLTLELNVRSLSPAGARSRQNAVIDRLEALEADGRIARFTTNVWGSRVGLSTTASRTEPGTVVLEQVATFRQWARENGRSLRSFFETRTTTSPITGEEYTTIVFPMIVLAEYRDGDLRHVAPCTDGERVYTVEDRLDAIAAGEPDLPDEHAPPDSAVRPVVEQ